MKKLLCIVAAAVVGISMASAQQTHFGLKAGLNISSVPVTDGNDFQSKTGLHIGGLAHIHISQHFALQPELLYSMQGGKSDNATLKLNYINIPVLAQYMTNDGFRLQTGPQIGFLTTAKSKTGNVETDLKDGFSSVDFSWAFGASYLIPNANGLGIDARYNLGISDISDNNAFEARNSVIQVGVFYQFMHGRIARHR